VSSVVPSGAQPVEDDGELSEALGRLADAADRDEAAEAAWEVVDLAIEGGSALADDAPAAVAGVAGLLGRETFSWVADALSLLDAIAGNLGSWRRAAEAATDPARFAPLVALEDETEEELRRLEPLVRRSCSAPDPETRAMAARTLAQISSDPAADAELLQGLIDREEQPLVKACLVEATVLLGARRRDGAPVFDEDAVARALRDPSRLVRYRVARAVRGKVSSALSPLVNQALEIDAAEQSTFVWPAEV
jgi:hypothetical protein